MTQTNTKMLAETSLLSAITVILMVISIAVPGLGEILGLFAPLPIVILCIRYDYLAGSTAAVFGIIISSAILTIPIALPTGVLYWIVGLIMGFSVKRKKTFKAAFLLLTIGIIIAFIFNIAVYTLFIDKKGLMGIIKINAEQFKASLNVIQKLGAHNTSDIKKIANFMSVNNLLLNIPAVLIVISAVYAYLSIIGISVVLKRLRFNVLSRPSVTRLYLDQWFVILLFIAFISGYLLSLRGYTLGKYIYNTGVYLIMVSFGLQGLSATAYYFIERLRTSKILAIILLSISVFLGGFTIYTYIGLADLFLDLRKINSARIFRF